MAGRKGTLLRVASPNSAKGKQVGRRKTPLGEKRAAAFSVPPRGSWLPLPGRREAAQTSWLNSGDRSIDEGTGL